MARLIGDLVIIVILELGTSAVPATIITIKHTVGIVRGVASQMIVLRLLADSTKRVTIAGCMVMLIKETRRAPRYSPWWLYFSFWNEPLPEWKLS